MAATATFWPNVDQSPSSHLRGRKLAETDTGFEVFRWFAIVVLVMLSGCFSGLTLGLLGLDTNQLAVRAPSPRIRCLSAP